MAIGMEALGLRTFMSAHRATLASIPPDAQLGTVAPSAQCVRKGTENLALLVENVVMMNSIGESRCCLYLPC